MVFTRISVLVPTRHRVKRLVRLLESFERTATADGTAELVFRVDSDDQVTQEFLSKKCHPLVIVGPRLKGYDSMPVFFNELAAATTGDVLMCGNDDMVFWTLGWPALLLAAANRFPDGLFDLGVKTLNETHYPFSTVSRAAVDRMGFLWDPEIFWGDIFLRDVMAAFGRCVMIPEVEIEHDWAGHSPDRVFNEADKDVVRRYPNYWTETHARAVHRAVAKLREAA